MKQKKIDIGKIIDEETENRLRTMEEANYVWPKKAGKGDVIAIVASILVCIALILMCVVEVSI